MTVFCNMAEDESLFTGRGDYQFDVYRLMKKANKYVLFNCTSSSKKIVVFTYIVSAYLIGIYPPESLTV